MLTVTLAEELFPATSTAVPLNVCMPGEFTVIGGGQTAILDRVSEHVKLTLTGVVVLTPEAFGAGEILAEMTGGFVSIFGVTVALAVCPAASVAVPLMTWCASSALIMCNDAAST